MNIQPNTLYDQDFYAWSLDMAAKIRTKQFDTIDIDNLAEEIESMARSDYRELLSRLIVLIAHLLKWEYQPMYRCGSWRGTIQEQRIKIHILLKDSPSLKNKLTHEAKSKDIYQYAIKIFSKDTDIDTKLLPLEIPYAISQLLNDEFYPERTA